MKDWRLVVESFFAKLKVGKLVWFVLLIAGIYLFFKILRKFVLRFAKPRVNKQWYYFIKKGIDYLAFVVIILTVFARFGINVSAILGAAGIVGIAIGFAAQTSVSNIISGFFIMSERILKIGDRIKVDSISGKVEDFSLLSVRLKTSDGQLVRIPNETMINKNIVNISHFDKRRFDFRFNILYSEDLEIVKKVLLNLIESNPLLLKEPEPIIVFDNFNGQNIEVLCGVWVKSSDFLKAKNQLMVEVTKSFVKENIVIKNNYNFF